MRSNLIASLVCTAAILGSLPNISSAHAQEEEDEVPRIQIVPKQQESIDDALMKLRETGQYTPQRHADLVLEQATDLFLGSDVPDGIALVRQAVRDLKANGHGNDPANITLHHALAELYRMEGNFRKAWQNENAASRIAKANFGENSVEAAQAELAAIQSFFTTIAFRPWQDQQFKSLTSISARTRRLMRQVSENNPGDTTLVMGARLQYANMMFNLGRNREAAFLADRLEDPPFGAHYSYYYGKAKDLSHAIISDITAVTGSNQHLHPILVATYTLLARIHYSLEEDDAIVQIADNIAQYLPETVGPIPILIEDRITGAFWPHQEPVWAEVGFCIGADGLARDIEIGASNARSRAKDQLHTIVNANILSRLYGVPEAFSGSDDYCTPRFERHTFSKGFGPKATMRRPSPLALLTVTDLQRSDVLKTDRVVR